MEVDESPTPKTVLTEEQPTNDLESRISNLERKVEKLKRDAYKSLHKVEKLKRVCKSLHKPIPSSRDRAVLSLLANQQRKLDAILQQILSLKAREACKNILGKNKRKAVQKRFLWNFRGISTYAQLLTFSEHSPKNQLLKNVLEAVEEQLLRGYEREGFQTSDTIQVRGSMAEYMAMQGIMGVSTPLFAFEHHEYTEREWQIQARVLLDIEKAVKEGWLAGAGFMKTLGGPNGTLLPEVFARMKELEDATGCSVGAIAAGCSIGEIATLRSNFELLLTSC